MLRAPEVIPAWNSPLSHDGRRFVVVVADSSEEAMHHVEAIQLAAPQQMIGVVINGLMPGDVAPLLPAGLNPVVAGPCSPRGLYRRVAESLQKGRLRLRRAPKM
jgi:hypothetical protein